MPTARYAQEALTELRYAPMVIINWSPAGLGLVRALAGVASGPPEAGPPVIAVGSRSEDEVAQAILFVITNDFVTGTTVDVDGGWLLT